MYEEYIGQKISIREFEKIAVDKFFFVTDIDPNNSDIGILRGVFDDKRNMGKFLNEYWKTSPGPGSFGQGEAITEVQGRNRARGYF